MSGVVFLQGFASASDILICKLKNTRVLGHSLSLPTCFCQLLVCWAGEQAAACFVGAVGASLPPNWTLYLGRFPCGLEFSRGWLSPV